MLPWQMKKLAYTTKTKNKTKNKNKERNTRATTNNQ